jgi:hypothetical protein
MTTVTSPCKPVLLYEKGRKALEQRGANTGMADNKKQKIKQQKMLQYVGYLELVSYLMISSMTHPSRNFFVLF